MKGVAADMWRRAQKALIAAKAIQSIDPDSAASRAYYAAFYAVSARFALKEQAFRRHSGLEIAVHRDLVKAGIWPAELGQAYSRLVEMRMTGDYGWDKHVSDMGATEAVEIATDIIAAVLRECGDTLDEAGADGV